MARRIFDDVLREAMADFEENGFDNAERLAYWQERIARAARESMMPEHVMEEQLRKAYASVFQREVERGHALKRHKGVPRFTLEKLKPQLRGELAKYIQASASLIKLDRERVVQETLQRLSGWVTSLPAGGTDQNSKDAKAHIKSGMGGLQFKERRVLIDQAHKLTSAINDVVAKGGGAIAAQWVSHAGEAGYNFREEHKERAERSERLPYLIRDSWADQSGYVKLAGAKYIDQITRPGEEIFCRCYYRYIYSLSGVPREQLTRKGADKLAEARRQMEAA